MARPIIAKCTSDFFQADFNEFSYYYLRSEGCGSQPSRATADAPFAGSDNCGCQSHPLAYGYPAYAAPRDSCMSSETTMVKTLGMTDCGCHNDFLAS